MTAPDGLPLKQRIVRLIEHGGPMRLSDYFALCVSDPDDGYYMTMEPFGSAGDFTTAPEITQLFGEMVGVFLVHAWRTQGSAANPVIVEIGPGRGTLMRDILRTVSRLAPALRTTAGIHLVETSPRLSRIQKETLRDTGFSDIRWHESLASVPDGHTLLVANELFDALPLAQYVKLGGAYRERVVRADAEDRLAFGLGTGVLPSTALPDDADARPEGTVFEIAPAREAMMQAIARRLVACGGTGLVIDYGHIVTGYGDTLQALHGGAFDDPLAHPGKADLTSHVDFDALVRAARQAGAHVAGLARQGEFLVGLGLLDRAGRLGADKTAEEQEAIRAAVERIAGEGQGLMGELFKVLAVTGKPAGLQPFAPAARPSGDGRTSD